jgi:hypothetical protein
MSETWLLVIVLGWPASVLFLAMLTGHFYRSNYRKLLDFKPARSPTREAELERREIEQMLAAHNRYRRLRGAPERSLEEVMAHALGSIGPYPHTSWPQDPELKR